MNEGLRVDLGFGTAGNPLTLRAHFPQTCANAFYSALGDPKHSRVCTALVRLQTLNCLAERVVLKGLTSFLCRRTQCRSGLALVLEDCIETCWTSFEAQALLGFWI